MSELAFFLHRLETTARPAPSATRPDERESRAAGFWPALRASGVLTSVAGLLATHLLETCFLLGSWVCVGSGALSGRLDYGWLAAWALALLTTVPLHALSTWLQGVVAMGFGGVLKQWMQDSATSAGCDGVRSKGAGRSLSEVLETVALDDLATNGGIAAVLAAVELLIAPLLLYWGGDSVLEALILLGWEILTIALIKHNLDLRAGWTQQRLAMTHRLIDTMAAQRTRLTQQSPAHWHEAEDADIERYLRTSRALDASTARIETALPRSYLIVAFLALAPGFVSGTATLAQLAVAIGVILFAKTALERLCFGFSRPATAWVAWQCIKPASASMPDVEAVSTAQEPLPELPVLQARELAFTYPGRLQPVLSKCSLSVQRGDHVLLEGASGSGKSTLAGILAGCRPASAGFILAGGLDRHTLGDTHWQRRIALVPQEHENHIFSASLFFNLLLGRSAPSRTQVEAEADALCRELGLGPLLDRMPAGLHQLVGDAGWELSQGERSRIFLARALLQRAELLILDETFAALDPESVRQCLECVQRRAPTMLVIAHP
jgi:ATP-binding cassette subfamily B protein